MSQRAAGAFNRGVQQVPAAARTKNAPGIRTRISRELRASFQLELSAFTLAPVEVLDGLAHYAVVGLDFDAVGTFMGVSELGHAGPGETTPR